MQSNCKTPPLLTILSAHRGPAPDIRPAEGEYTSYFETSLGDQWILTVAADRTRGTLRGGDLDWEPISIVDDQVRGHALLGAEEFDWLRLCWRAATGRELQRPPLLEAIEMAKAMTPEEAEAMIQHFEQMRERLRRRD